MLTREEAIKVLNTVKLKVERKCSHGFLGICTRCIDGIIELLITKQPEQSRRKPINSSVCSMDNVTEIVSTCDDGAQFYLKIEDWSGSTIHAGKWEKLPPIPQDKLDPRECEHKNLDIISEDDLRKISWCKDCGARITENIDPNTNKPIPQDDETTTKEDK